MQMSLLSPPFDARSNSVWTTNSEVCQTLYCAGEKTLHYTQMQCPLSPFQSCARNPVWITNLSNRDKRKIEPASLLHMTFCKKKEVLLHFLIFPKRKKIALCKCHAISHTPKHLQSCLESKTSQVLFSDLPLGFSAEVEIGVCPRISNKCVWPKFLHTSFLIKSGNTNILSLKLVFQNMQRSQLLLQKLKKIAIKCSRSSSATRRHQRNLSCSSTILHIMNWKNCFSSELP